MAKILGLDLGTNSIGWAVVDDEKNKILDTGVRIYPEGVTAKTIGLGDKEVSRNATRRDARQLRRQFYRKRLRKIKLLELLIEQDMCPLKRAELFEWKNWDKTKKSEGRVFPNSPEFVDWIKLNPYQLRAKAINKQVSKYELGRIFYHLIQRRGFLSSRKGGADPQTLFERGKPEENILPIKETKEKIKGTSLGYYLNSIANKENEAYKFQELRLRGRYTIREMYIEEFDKIWTEQNKFYDLDSKTTIFTKIRETKGSINNKKNTTRLNYLKEKYGEANVEVVEITDKNNLSNNDETQSVKKETRHKIITKEEISLKYVLAGDIEYITDDDGERKVKFKSNESILYWQRPLRSQKGLLANCRFEDELPVINKNGEFSKDENGEIIKRSKKPCPLSHPEFEEFRAWQFINNIYFGKRNPLSDEQKQIVLDLINKKKKNFNFTEIIKALKLNYEKFNYDEKFTVTANTTISQLSELFEPEVWKEKYDEIWHCFYFYEDDDKLYEKLKKSYAYSGNLETVSKIKLKDGYCNVSLKAIRNILPFLKQGYLYDKAVILGGVKNAFGKRWEYFQDYHYDIINKVVAVLKEDNKEGEAILKIKEVLSSKTNRYGFSVDDPRFFHLYHHSQSVEQKKDLNDRLPVVENLRNPIVQQGVNEMRRLVNALMKKYQIEFGDYFRFDKIKVEMGRDLRNTKSARQDMTIRIRENEKKNDEARSRLQEYGLQPSRNNVQKYLMWKEIADVSGTPRCPYTGKTIAISDLLGSSNTVQIEHIIPYSISLDDSFGNKTICESHFNNLKGELTPYQFYQKNPDVKLWGVSSWDAVADRAFQILPYAKAKKFTIKSELKLDDFIERQLNDTRYIAKKSVELLSNICSDVRVMPGQLTAELRHLWGLNNILQDNIPNLQEELGKVKNIENNNCFLVLNEDNEIIEIVPKQNSRPKTNSDEILLPIIVKGKKLVSDSFNLDIDLENYPDGKYWAKLKVDNDFLIIPRYVQKPLVSEDRIVFRGKIEKQTFKNDTSGNIKVTNKEDGVYWVDIAIKNKEFKNAQTQKSRPDVKPKSKIVLFGNVKDEKFSCYIYNCKTNLPDGKYWLILELDINDVNFTKAVNDKPDLDANNQICLNATVNDLQELVLDIDNLSNFKVNEAAGKYFTKIKIKEINPNLNLIENNPPILKEKTHKILEGVIWADKYSGEIKFDPKKKRDDHRHHAVDAIVIALTEQGFLQKLSTWHASDDIKYKERLDDSEKFPMPWDEFYTDTKKAVNSILVSHKKQNKTLTRNKKGFSVRGQLHKETVFGLRQAPKQEQAHHFRVKVTSIEDEKKYKKIVDEGIKEIIRNYLLAKYGKDIKYAENFKIPKDAFYENNEWTLFLPNKRGDKVPIKKVRIKENLSNTVQLKSDLNQYVNPRNNHHVIIYKDLEGKLQEDVVQFWTAVERKQKGESAYQLPEDGLEIIEILEINDMFLLGLSEEEYEDNKNNKEFLSKYLYRVQKVTSKFYTFRKHNASTLDNSEYEFRIQSMSAWEKANPIRYKISL
ncbi:MAG: hypothetical protein GX793_09025 [Bacteroidales bacterium]|nr:hypothetical protein [Bacteroidales bacterium]MCK9499987.1 hypothetical protein [Bacteroidales bacterium]MDY0315540.1 HNH endonuclease domain-containing protein [Bacteroidales bacterium]NLB87188.1 hypothetical protein [Bacteroidales bacterium]